jgi:hypothetical protein
MTDELLAALWAAVDGRTWVHPQTGPLWGTVTIKLKDGKAELITPTFAIGAEGMRDMAAKAAGEGKRP